MQSSAVKAAPLNSTNERLWKMFRDNEPKVNAARKETRLFKLNTAGPLAEVSSSKVLSLTRNVDLLKSKEIITELVDELRKTQSDNVQYESGRQILLKYTQELTKYNTNLGHRVEESKQKAKKAKDECESDIREESDLQRQFEGLQKLKKVPLWCETPTAGSSDPSPMAQPPTSVSSTPVAPPLPSSLQPSVNNKKSDSAPRLSCSSQVLEEKLKRLSSNHQTRLLLDEIDAQIIELRRSRPEWLQKSLSKFLGNDDETIAKLTAEQDDLLKKQTADFKKAFAKLSGEQEKLCQAAHDCHLLQGRIESLNQQNAALLEEHKRYKQERVDYQKISAMMKTKQEQLKRKIQELADPLAAAAPTEEQQLDTKHSVRATVTANLSGSSVPAAPPLAPALLPLSSGGSTAQVQQATDCAPAPTDCAPASKTADASPRASSALWKAPVVASATKTSQRRSSTPVPQRRWR